MLRKIINYHKYNGNGESRDAAMIIEEKDLTSQLLCKTGGRFVCKNRQGGRNGGKCEKKWQF